MPITENGVPTRVEPDKDAEPRTHRSHRVRDTLLSIAFGIVVYVVVQLIVAVLFGLGGLLIQIPAIIVGVVLARGLYMYLGRTPVKAAIDAGENLPDAN